MADYLLTSDEQAFINEFDLEPSTPCKGWDGYVDPQGRFYATKPTGISYYNGSFNLHRDWAEAYYLNQGIREHALLAKSIDTDHISCAMDYLVITDGWASCTFNLGDRIYIQPPRHNKENLTTAQKETIFKLFQINKYPMNVYFQSCE